MNKEIYKSEIKKKIAFVIFCVNFSDCKGENILKLWRIMDKSEKQKYYDMAEYFLKLDINKIDKIKGK